MNHCWIAVRPGKTSAVHKRSIRALSLQTFSTCKVPLDNFVDGVALNKLQNLEEIVDRVELNPNYTKQIKAV